MPGRHDHHAGIGHAGRGHAAQGPQQALAVVADRPDPVGPHDRREEAGHQVPVLQHVGDAAGVAQVVLQDPQPAVGAPHQVEAGDQAPHAGGGGHAHGLPDEAVRGRDQPPRHDPVPHGGPLTDVEVLEEGVEGRHPLDEPGLQVPPRRPADHPGQDVHGQGALEVLVALALGLGVGAEGEGDAPLAHGVIAHGGSPGQLLVRHRPQAVEEDLVLGAEVVRLVDGLVVEAPGVVTGQQSRRRFRHGPHGLGHGGIRVWQPCFGHVKASYLFRRSSTSRRGRRP